MMGTRADFYVGRGVGAEWTGSITWDGYPAGIDPDVLSATSEQDFRQTVTTFFAQRDDVTLPTEPWPWPWKDSRTTGYAYAWDGAVYASSFGCPWFEIDMDREDFGEPDDGDGSKVTFPDMSDRKGDLNHIMAKSGMIIVSFPEDGVS